MTGPRLKVGNVVRDDSYEGVARVRLDATGTMVYLDAEDVRALALMLASPPAVNRAALAAAARRETDERRREENARAEAERIAAGAAREADARRLREQFPALAAEILGPAPDGAPAFRLFTAEGGQMMYFEKYGLGGGRLHTSERSKAMRFGTREAAQRQADSLGSRGYTPYLVEAP